MRATARASSALARAVDRLGGEHDQATGAQPFRGDRDRRRVVTGQDRRAGRPRRAGRGVATGVAADRANECAPRGAAGSSSMLVHLAQDRAFRAGRSAHVERRPCGTGRAALAPAPVRRSYDRAAHADTHDGEPTRPGRLERWRATGTSSGPGGQGVSSFGDAITNTALPLLVLALTGSGFAMGIVGRSRRSRTSLSGFRPERMPIAGTAAG